MEPKESGVPMQDSIANTPLVSVLVPAYNVQQYVGECLRKLTMQTLDNLEIILVNDGSTDATLEIAQSFAARDPRIRIIDKPNSGYGASMNRALAEARGSYIGIIESDDYPDIAMFSVLARTALKYDADVVKCNYYEHWDKRDYARFNLDGFPYRQPFDPLERPDVVCIPATIWTAIYRREMLEREGVAFRETPGAAFQDTGFALKAWFAARTCVFLRRTFLHYRVDNPYASTKTTDKAFQVMDEFADSMDYLRARPEKHGVFAPWVYVSAWDKYRWNYERIAPELRAGFLQRVQGEFQAARNEEVLDESLFDQVSRGQLVKLLMEGVEAFMAAYPDSYPTQWQVEADRARARHADLPAFFRRFD